MDRLLQFHRGYLDNMLKELKNKGIDLYEYLDGSIFDITINKKKYKIFQVTSPESLKYKIHEFEKARLRKDIIEKYSKEGVQINKAIGGWRTINHEIDEAVNEIYNFVIQKYNILETLEKQGFIDMVYNKDGYKPAPGKVGRPTQKAKEYRINARLTEKQYNKLEEYAVKYNMKISEALRDILEFRI